MSDDSYEAILDRAVPQALANAPKILEERSTAPDRLVELLNSPEPEREAVMKADRRFYSCSLVTHALDRSEKVVSCNPTFALLLTRLARTILAHIDPQTCGGRQALADLGAYALAMEGNVRRVCGDMAVAVAAFGRSRELQKRGGVDPDLTARIDLMESSLRRDLRQLDTAWTLLDRSTQGFLEVGERKWLICARINRANLLLVQEKLDEAASILEALKEISDPQVALCVRHNLASVLVASGRSQEAARLIEEIHDLYLRFSDPLIENRRLWLEAMIASGLGQKKRATILLKEASSNLHERGYTFDAALARLDLAKLQARRGGEPLYTC